MKKLLLSLFLVVLFPIDASAQETVLTGDTLHFADILFPMYDTQVHDSPPINTDVYETDSGSKVFVWSWGSSMQQSIPLCFRTTFFSPVPGQYFDTTQWTISYMFYRGLSYEEHKLTEFREVTVIQDSQLRIRPKSLVVEMHFDTLYRSWIGSSWPRFENQNVIDCRVANISLQMDSDNSTHMQVFESGNPFSQTVLKPGQYDGNIYHFFYSTGGSRDRNVVLYGLLRTTSQTDKGDSVFSNPITFILYSSPHASVDGSAR